jgi:hypothetical protein
MDAESFITQLTIIDKFNTLGLTGDIWEKIWYV